jgi:REP element-mobilizing transposase RayT
MPQPGLRWWHVIINTRSSWLHGDARGFRSRNHRIHSSGDYKAPPPPGEHVGLLRYHQKRAAPRVATPPEMRRCIGQEIIEFFTARGYRVLAISVCSVHVHILVELPVEYKVAWSIIGKCKNIVSYRVRDEMPGAIWSRGATIKPINNRAHQVRAYHYIFEAQESGAWTWSMLEASRRGKRIRG